MERKFGCLRRVEGSSLNLETMAILRERPSSFRQNVFSLFFFVAIVITMNSVAMGKDANKSLTYIVSVQSQQTGIALLGLHDRIKWYKSFLMKSTGSTTSDRLVYVYKNVMTGFAARLTKAEAETIRNSSGCIDVIPDALLSLHTTYSPKFLSLDPRKGVWPRTGFGKGAIVGVVDSGVWPESASFSDAGIPRPPAQWKGFCQSAPDFNSSNCNNKLIGARIFNKVAKRAGSSADVDTPRDAVGHGTHTASTAAGNSVPNANIFGYANGTARGMAPYSHLAVYKACFGAADNVGCFFSDVLAAIDQAISDGVDVLSLSLGGDSVFGSYAPPLYSDLIAMGAFRAVQRGIFVACSAGNDGPNLFSVVNSAPWIMTVGAATMDRRFVVSVNLGNGKILYGKSLNPAKSGKTNDLPLVIGSPDPTCSYINSSLDPKIVSGKLVICRRSDPDGIQNRLERGLAVQEAGGAGMILINNVVKPEDVVAEAYLLPAAHLNFKDGVALQAYMNSTKTPTAALKSEGTVFGGRRAPSVASFSSRGPSPVSAGILKPDVIAPGDTIVAAWPSDLSPSPLPQDHRIVMFNTMSGTSMACPHVSGIAAVLKISHPDWSPAAIKSALMTTADIVDRKGRPILDTATVRPADVVDMGSGHINAERADDPGLIYDLTAQDYIPYLCGLRYTPAQIEMIVQRKVTCPPASDESTVLGNLNYPSFSVNVTAVPFLATLKRTVTNVGLANSTYTVNIVAPNGVEVIVNPKSLSFRAVSEKKSFNVTFEVKRRPGKSTSLSQGSITWVSSFSTHLVRSPISFIWK